MCVCVCLCPSVCRRVFACLCLSVSVCACPSPCCVRLCLTSRVRLSLSVSFCVCLCLSVVCQFLSSLVCGLSSLVCVCPFSCLFQELRSSLLFPQNETVVVCIRFQLPQKKTQKKIKAKNRKLSFSCCSSFSELKALEKVKQDF